MVNPLSVDVRIMALVPDVDPTLRGELVLAVRTLRNANNPVGVVIGMSRMSLRLVGDIYSHAGHTAPSQNLFDCIVTAAGGDPGRKTPGLQLLPDELASCLHTIRVLSNKVDHNAEQISLSVDDAENALWLFLRVVEWFYCEYGVGPLLPTIYDLTRFQDLPQLAGRSLASTNIPVPPTPLIGRERELAEVLGLLRHDGVWLVTLTGVGGSGKTRLALEIGIGAVSMFPAGAFFVDLSPITDPEQVIPRIAHTLGVPQTGDLSVLTCLQEYLQDQQLLLVLDNFEQVVEASPSVAELHASCASIKVLVTSRASLRLRGEWEYPVSPLPVPATGVVLPPEQLLQVPAVELFVQRAASVLPAFSMTDANAPAISEICVRLDGLPLAIELAAARVKTLAPSGILERLNNRLRLLTGGARDLPERQQTLRTAINWSYDLLKSPEQWLFRQLSVFAGGITLEAAEAVCASEECDIPDSLAELVDNSLLTRTLSSTGEYRFDMLESLKEYGIERLIERGELLGVRRTHANWFLGLAEQARTQLSGPNQSTWLTQLETEHDNLRTALRWLLADNNAEGALRLTASLWWFWWVHGHLSEGRDWLSQALADPANAPAALRARALVGAGTLCEAQGDYEHAVQLHEEALVLCRTSGDELGTATALDSLGTIAQDRGDYQRATVLHEQALALCKALGDRQGEAQALINLGTDAAYQHDVDRATARYREGLTLLRAVGDKQSIAGGLTNFGTFSFLHGDLDSAVALYEEAAAIYRELGDKQCTALVLGNLGEVALRRDDPERAVTLCAQALSLYQELGDKRGKASILDTLSKVEQTQGNAARASMLLAESLTLYQEIGDKEAVASGLESSAGLATLQGYWQRGILLYGAAEALRDDIGAPLPDVYRSDYNRHLDSARTSLGASAFAAAWRAGRNLSSEQAVMEILAHPFGQ